MKDLLKTLKEADQAFEETGYQDWELKDEIERLESFIKLGEKLERLAK